MIYYLLYNLRFNLFNTTRIKILDIFWRFLFNEKWQQIFSWTHTFDLLQKNNCMVVVRRLAVQLFLETVPKSPVNNLLYSALKTTDRKTIGFLFPFGCKNQKHIGFFLAYCWDRSLVQSRSLHSPLSHEQGSSWKHNFPAPLNWIMRWWVDFLTPQTEREHMHR